jgi:hypothetical protein
MLILAWIILIGLPLAVLLCWSAVVSEGEWWEPALALLTLVVFTACALGIVFLMAWAAGVVFGK